MKFIYSVQSEWIKTKRSSASWLCIIGGFFIPLIYILKFCYDGNSINSYKVDIWKLLFNQMWQNMATFLLPMGVILASSLITQLEYKNNTWKQVHASPQSFTTIFFSKLAVIGLMTLKFFLFFNIGILVAGILPSLLFDHKLPIQGIPITYFLRANFNYFVTCLPILAIQYLISLKFNNFLIAVGIGLLGLIGSLIAMPWKYVYLFPYSYSPMTVFPGKKDFPIYTYAFVYFAIIMIISYILYVSKKEKG
jgi:hypothetical protein